MALEVERPRRGTPVFVLLAAAGLLRPDAWVLSGGVLAVVRVAGARGPGRRGRDGRQRGGGRGPAQAQERSRRRPLRRRAAPRHRAGRAAPLLWVAFDTIVTGDPLYSLHSTAVLAAELERTQGFTSVLAVDLALPACGSTSCRSCWEASPAWCSASG